MKRDMELIRELMLAIESRNDTQYWAEDLEVSGDRDITEIIGHLQILVDAKFIEATVASDDCGTSIAIDRMLWNGHEFLDNARNESVWKKAMSIVTEKGGSVSAGVLMQVLASAAKQHFGLS
jgi:Hypothetical protein (DUF2513)